ncbi:hypothetical protein PAB09_00640 [Corynebacterium sp. SCR221107]|uniref:hypothetical protein n=1 Tax=Corynebacterium sp. SCR221107 TaxID=3017361 RepID=UPI0022EC392E|nr:hypothetical protein [Corynebacterium sp. SCR221107]WBT08902.1 hypothetical protein PAB09_00640 [Corynebacterium sp. SCR221107]
MHQWQTILDQIAVDRMMLSSWDKYVKKNPYATGVSLSQCCESAKEIMIAVHDAQEF